MNLSEKNAVIASEDLPFEDSGGSVLILPVSSKGFQWVGVCPGAEFALMEKIRMLGGWDC